MSNGIHSIASVSNPKSMTTPLGIGFFTDNIPAGAQVMELKQCENCVRSFLRPRAGHRAVVVKNKNYDGTIEENSIIYKDTGERFCKECRSRLLQPDESAQEIIKEMLPTEGQMRHSNHLLRYRSELPRPRQRYGNWRMRVTEALVARGPLSAEELQEIVGHKDSDSPFMTLSLFRSSGFKLVRVGNAARRLVNGRPPGLYTLPHLAQALAVQETAEVVERIENASEEGGQ